MADFENSSEIDIEDLEAHLYGQIYHSTLSEETDMESQNNSRDYELNRLNNKKTNRYYENPDINVVPQPYQPNKFIDLRNSNSTDDQTGGMPQNFYNRQNNLYNYQNPPYNDTYSNTCQQFILPGSPGINNIVVIPPAPTQCFSTAFHPLFNKSNRRKQAKQKKKLKPDDPTQTPFKEHRKQNRIPTPITEQTQPNKTTSSNKTQSNPKVKSSSNVDVVVLSDSDNSDIEEVILENTIIDISSNDDENTEELGAEECKVKATENEGKSQKKEDNETVEGIQVKGEIQETKKAEKNGNLETDNEDDVIVFVEKPVEQEIIVVEDTKDSICSTDVTITIEEKSLIERIEPEEVNNPLMDVTNDFLDSVQLGQHYFNFQLHGSDFYCSKSTSQLKSNVNNEAYETESSSSTVDIPIRSNALNDIGFDSPCKEVFDEPNLESFANFITPKRKLDTVATQESSKPKRKKSKSPKIRAQENEEDLNDEEKTLKNKKKSKVAQDIIELEDEEKSSKKKKKGKSQEHYDESCGLLDIENEHDGSIIPLELSESGTPKPKKKKKRKNEKSTEKSLDQTLDNSIGQDHDVGEAPQTSVSSKKRKRKNKQVDKKSDSDTAKSDTNQANEHSTVSIEFTNDSDSDDINIYTVDYESDNNSNSNLSFCTIAETGMANRDKQEDDDSFDDFSSISDVGEDVEVVNVNMGQEYPLEKIGAHPTRKQFSDFWDNDMKKFYSESWGHENFSVSESQKFMSDDPNIWKILDRDRYLYYQPRGPRCRSCRQWGHLTYRCPNKSNFLVCTLCGGKGHMEPRCPNKICTSCGQQMNYFTTYCTRCKGFMNVTCSICNMRGHPTKMCPDLWRRYHLTTKEGPVVFPKSDLVKPFHKRWCSGCGSQGHFEHDCKYYNRTHSATLFAIQSYEPVYEPTKKSPVKRKQENEDGLSKKKQLKTTHQRTDKNKGEIGSKGNLNESGSKLNEIGNPKGKNQQEIGQKCRKERVKSKETKKQEAAVKSKNKNKKEQRKQKATGKPKQKNKKQNKIHKETATKLKDKSKEEETSGVVENKTNNILKLVEERSMEQEILNERDKQQETNSTGQSKEIENSESLEINHYKEGSKSKEIEMQKEVFNLEERQKGETAKSSEKNDKKEDSQSQEENQEDIPIENNDMSISQERNQVEIIAKSNQGNDEEKINNQEEETKSKENNSRDEVPKSPEENQNEADITKYDEIIRHEEVKSEYEEEFKQEQALQSQDETLQKVKEITISEEVSTLQEKGQQGISIDIQQQEKSKDQEEVPANHSEKTSTYDKKLEEFAKNIKEIYKATDDSKPLSKKQKKKLAKSQNNPPHQKPQSNKQTQRQSQQKTQSQPKTQSQQQQSKNKNNKKNKPMRVQPPARPGSLFGDPVSSQFLMNPWASWASVLNPSMFYPPGTAHLQNPNFYGAPFHTNNYQIPFHANLQDLFSGNSIFSSPAFLHANPFMQSHMGQGYPNLGRVPPNIGQGQLNMGQGLANMGQGLVNMGQGLANMRQGQPNMGQGQSNMGQGQPNMGQGQTNMGQCQPNMGQGQTNMGQGQPTMGQLQPCIGQDPPNVGQELPNSNIQTFEVNNEQEETIRDTSTIDLTEPDEKVNDLTNTGSDEKVKEIDLTRAPRDETNENEQDKRNITNTIDVTPPNIKNLTPDDPFTICLTSNESSLIKRAHGRFFMRDLSTTYGVTYHFQEKKKMVITGYIDDNIMDMIKAEINDYFRINRQVSGLYPLPKNYSDAKQVVKEYMDFMGPLERLTYHFAQLIRLSKAGNRNEHAVRKMTYKIIFINRILIGKLFLKDGKKHLDILKNKFLKGGAQKGEIKGQEWDSLNESFTHVFQNDTDELLSIEFLSNLPTHIVPKKINDDIWKPFIGLKKEDRKSIHFILNNREAYFCVKSLFHYLDAERMKFSKKGKKKQRLEEEKNNQR